MLCTSGTAAANLHPAVCEADESAVPLIALTADRPPELRGIGAGQTIDQLKLYGDSVRWFCEVGTHEADDAGLLHYRSVACRAFAAARGDPRARPGPPQPRLARAAGAGRAVAARSPPTDPLALEGRGERPLTAVALGPARPDEFMVDELAKHLGDAQRPLIVAGRQTDPGLREPLSALARAAGDPDPRRTDLAASAAAPTTARCVVSAYDSILRADGRAGRSRSGPALRRDADLQAAAPVARRLGGGPAGDRPRPGLERAEQPGRGDRPRRPGGAGERRRASGSRRLRNRLAGCLARGRVRCPRRARSRRWPRSTSSASPASPPPSAAAYADGDLVYTASSMPIRDQEAFLDPGDADVRFLANRGANGIDGLVSSGIGAAHASGRPTVIVTGDLGLLHDLGGLAALRGVTAPGADRRRQQRRRRHLRLPPPGRGDARGRVRGAARHPAGSRRRPRRGALRPRAPADRRPRRPPGCP